MIHIIRSALRDVKILRGEGNFRFRNMVVVSWFHFKQVKIGDGWATEKSNLKF